MSRVSSIFSQLLQFFPRLEFETPVRKHNAERHARGFTCGQEFVAMLFCQLAYAQSLREIFGGLAVLEGKLRQQGLKVTTFVGTGENAVQIQIWTALIAMLILEHLPLRSTLDWSLSSLIVLRRQQLSVHRELRPWLTDQYNAPPPMVAAEQFLLGL